MLLIDLLYGAALGTWLFFNQFLPVDTSAVVIKNASQGKDVIYFRKGENNTDVQECLNQQNVGNKANIDFVLSPFDYSIGRLGTALLVEDDRTVEGLVAGLETQGITLKVKTIDRSSIRSKKRASNVFAKKLQRLTSCDECEFLGIFVPTDAVDPSQGFGSWVASWFCGQPTVRRDSMRSPCAVGDFIADAKSRVPGKTQYIVADTHWYFNVNQASGVCTDGAALNAIYDGFDYGRSCKPTQYQNMGILIKKGTELLWFKLEKFIVSGASCVPN